MYTIADLKAQEHHISVGEAFVRNQKRIISERAKLGLSTTTDEHWLAVFVEGLARHRQRLSEILDELNGGSDAPTAIKDDFKFESRSVAIGYLGVSCQKYHAPSYSKYFPSAPVI